MGVCQKKDLAHPHIVALRFVIFLLNEIMD